MELKKREEIIKSLENCKGGGNGCLSCTYFYKAVDTSCAPFLIKDALALIKELTEEIKDLEADYGLVYEQAEADIHGNMADGGTSCHWCMDKTKADTVKRMQERLKQYENAHVTTPCNFCKHSLKGNRNERCDDDLQCLGFNKWESVIDQVAKELLEGNK